MRKIQRIEQLEEQRLRRLNAELGEVLAKEIWPHLSDTQLTTVIEGDLSPFLTLPAGRHAIQLSCSVDRLVVNNPRLMAIAQQMIREAIPT